MSRIAGLLGFDSQIRSEYVCNTDERIQMYDPSHCRIPTGRGNTSFADSGTESAQSGSASQNNEVAVEHGIYHKPDTLPNTRGMEIMSESEAYHKHGATACSKCFPSQKAGLYPNSYLR